MRYEKKMLLFLYLLRFFLILNFILFLFLFYKREYWHIYAYLNGIFVLGYLWFNTIRLFFNDLKKKVYEPLSSGIGYSVVLPYYNEEVKILKDTVDSIISQNDIFKKELIIIDDGSKDDNIWKELKKIKDEHPHFDIHLIRVPNNRGKRHAHKIAFQRAKYEFIVSMDSDTFIAPNAISKLLVPFSNPKVAATTGNILLRNEKQNMLTMVQAGLYWIGLNIYKKSQSAQGNVVCCSGCLSAYKKSDLMLILDDYLNQTFLGNKCHASEDRFLTNLINEMGKDVIYVEDAKCYTEAPATMSKFIKQQMRWKRGYYRECLYTISYSWKTSKVLYFETLFVFLVTPFLNLSMRLMAMYAIIFEPLFFLKVLLPSWIIFLVCRDAIFFIEEPGKAIRYTPYMVLYTILLYPMNVYSVLMKRPEKWGTR